MKTNKFIFFILLNTCLIVSITGCLSSYNNDRKLISSLLEKMALNERDGIITERSDCLLDAVRFLEELTGYERNTKFGHWGEYYENYHSIISDSLMYDYILTNMTKDVLHQKIKNNCSSLIIYLNQGCLDNMRISDYESYMKIYTIECSKK